LIFLPTGFLLRLADESHFADYFYLYAAVPLALGVYLTWQGFIARRR
jgi:hypothetical protein